MPFRHVAMYRWAEHVDDDHVRRLDEALEALSSQIPEVRYVTHGSDAGVSEGSFDYTMVIDVGGAASWRVTQNHPAYILLIEELLTNHVVERAVSQFTTRGGGGPAAEFDADDLSDDELFERARRAAQASMDALLAEPDDVF